MKKKIYLKPETKEIMIPYQPLLAGSPISKSGDSVDDFENLVSREMEPFDLP